MFERCFIKIVSKSKSLKKMFDGRREEGRGWVVIQRVYQGIEERRSFLFW